MRFLALCFLLPLAAHADCGGRNLIDALPPDQRTALETAANAVPFATGNIWHATKGGQDITLIGTFHLNDPRFDQIIAAVEPTLANASALLVEAGPQEEAALKSFIADHPERLINQTGPTLPEVLSPEDWQKVVTALQARNMPAFFGAKLQPWYLTTILSIPACEFSTAAVDSGLDKRLMAMAAAKSIPVKALETFDTILSVFDSFTSDEQLDMLTQALDTGGAAEADMAMTVSDSYFAGTNRLFWEFSRQQLLALPGADPAKVAREFDQIEATIITRRNRSWIPLILQAAAAKSPILVAVGALHLPGEQGVLNLLKQDGWDITPW